MHLRGRRGSTCRVLHAAVHSTPFTLSLTAAGPLSVLACRRGPQRRAWRHAAVHGHEGAAAGLAAGTPGGLPVRWAGVSLLPAVASVRCSSACRQCVACGHACPSWLQYCVRAHLPPPLQPCVLPCLPPPLPPPCSSPRKPPEDEREIKRNDEIRKLSPTEQTVQVNGVAGWQALPATSQVPHRVQLRVCWLGHAQPPIHPAPPPPPPPPPRPPLFLTAAQEARLSEAARRRGACRRRRHGANPGARAAAGAVV